MVTRHQDYLLKIILTYLFGHRRLRSFAWIRWNDGVSKLKVKDRVLDNGFENIPSYHYKLGRLRWLGHVLRMANIRLPSCALFFVPPARWKKPRGSQRMT